MTRNRFLTAFVLPVAILAAVVLPGLLLADRLPSPLATHWGGSGPDGSTDRALFLGLCAAAWAVAWALLLREARCPERSLIAPWVLGFGGGLASISASTVVANLDAARWTDADHLTWAVAALTLAAGVALAAAGAWLERVHPVAAAEPLPVTSAGLAPGERFYWTSTARANRWLPILTATVGLATVAAAAFTSAPVPVLVVPAVIVPVVGWLTSHTRLTVTPDEVRARMATVLPRRTVPMSAIRAAEAIEVDPLQWGGWGWRATPKATALIVRRGEGVRLRLTSGRDLVVTVDDAAVAAGLINDRIGADAS